MDRIQAWVLQHRIAIGVGLFALGLCASVFLAFAASSKDPPDGAQSAILVIVGGALNLGGAWAVSRRPGGPNLVASRMTVRHLAAIVEGIGDITGLAERAFERRPPGESREDIGELSWKLSSVESRLIINLEDWARAYPDLIEDEPGEVAKHENARRYD